ncbi:hypothetical protein V6N11_043740 [Hibiscus sabdariffa]|uniref:Uncharacterized protein n=1 Tax=Hibiscus sabdariffa TaxID=183260 RepID=A0ABR2RD43_9ROSI
MRLVFPSLTSFINYFADLDKKMKAMVTLLEESDKSISSCQKKSNTPSVEASNDPIWEASHTCHESVVDDSEYDHYRSDFKYLNMLADDLASIEQCNMVFMRKLEEQSNREFSDEEMSPSFKRVVSKRRIHDLELQS